MEKTEDLDKRLITLLAILVLSIVCFIHYFSRNAGLFLNIVFAGYKILLIVTFIIAGGVAYRNLGTTDRPDDWNDQKVPNKDGLAALIYIIYSYQGWENANYVSCSKIKIQSPSYSPKSSLIKVPFLGWRGIEN